MDVKDHLQGMILSSYHMGPTDELSLSGLAASAFTCSAISQVFL